MYAVSLALSAVSRSRRALASSALVVRLARATVSSSATPDGAAATTVIAVARKRSAECVVDAIARGSAHRPVCVFTHRRRVVRRLADASLARIRAPCAVPATPTHSVLLVIGARRILEPTQRVLTLRLARVRSDRPRHRIDLRATKLARRTTCFVTAEASGSAGCQIGTTVAVLGRGTSARRVPAHEIPRVDWILAAVVLS